MCGINGITEKNEDLVLKMNEALKHRGPDATAVWTDGKVTLGANRLAIIDLSPGANQPISTPDGRYTIVFNGEIYNYKELRANLTSYPFKTQGDTEVVLALFQKEGVLAFNKLDGMFAIAIWDARKEELILARDHSGIKPLYYRHEGTMLAFSSEVKGILEDGRVARKINRAVLERYLRLRYVPEPETLVEGVRKLPPASYAVFSKGVLRIEKFYEPRLSPLSSLSHAEMVAKTSELIDASVKRQLISERPLGVFLSGGLDSTIVLDAATKAGGTMETFSLSFELSQEEQAEKFNADAQLAALSARHYGSKHHDVVFTENEFVDMLPDAIRFLDQPIGNATALAQLALAKKARERIVVALQGDGGDELFGGYPRYRLSRLMDIYQRTPSFARDALSHLSPKLEKLNTRAGVERVELFLFEKEAHLARAVSEEFISHRPAEWFAERYLKGRDENDFTQLLMDADRRSWLVDEALARTDTMTMGASLEARVPLLSADIVSFASSLPTSARVGLFKNKKLLREAYAKRLPRHILSAQKRGFFSPMAKWIRRPKLQALARETLSHGFHPQTDTLLLPDATSLLDAHVQGEYAVNTLWTLVTLRLWAREFKMSI